MRRLIENLKSHDSLGKRDGLILCSLYIEQAKTYVKNATGKQTEYLIIYGSRHFL